MGLGSKGANVAEPMVPVGADGSITPVRYRQLPQTPAQKTGMSTSSTAPGSFNTSVVETRPAESTVAA